LTWLRSFSTRLVFVLTQEFFVSTRAAVEICGVALFHEAATCARRIARCRSSIASSKRCRASLRFIACEREFLNRNADAAWVDAAASPQWRFVYVLTAGTLDARTFLQDRHRECRALPSAPRQSLFPLLDKIDGFESCRQLRLLSRCYSGRRFARKDGIEVGENFLRPEILRTGMAARITFPAESTSTRDGIPSPAFFAIASFAF